MAAVMERRPRLVTRADSGTSVQPAGRSVLPFSISLESLEKTVFPFASGRVLEYRLAHLTRRGCRFFMIVCSCNVLTDHDVRSAVGAADDLPRNAKQVYGCLGCSAECGRCARTIKTIIDEALGACAKACCSGCPHSHVAANSHGHDAFALAAS
jgi:bacterioferritin-associated ferredoxin